MGIRIAGIPGVVIATLGCIVPALVLVSLPTYVYNKYKDSSLLQNVLAYLRPLVASADPGSRAVHPGHGALWRGRPRPADGGLDRRGQFPCVVRSPAPVQVEPDPDHVPVRRGGFAASSGFSRCITTQKRLPQSLVPDKSCKQI